MTKTTNPKRSGAMKSEDSSHEDISLSSLHPSETVKIFYPSEGGPLSCPLSAAPVERINERELHSIYALLAYVAHNQNVRQETVQMIVEAQFGVDNVAKIHRDDYMKAIEFLVDLKMDEIMN